MATKKNKQANGGKTAAMAITDFFEQMKPKATNGERVVKLAKERDFLCDRIAGYAHFKTIAGRMKADLKMSFPRKRKGKEKG